MSLKTHSLALTASAQTVFEAPYGTEATAHTIMATGTGSLTLSFYSASTGATLPIYSGVSVTGEKTMDKAIDFAPGDKLTASGAGLNLFVSTYSVGSDQGSAAPALGPGPQTLIAGDMQAGFFGEVSASELFSGDELALMTGVTEGIAQNSTSGWLKFAHNGKIKYIAKKTIRHTVTWDHLYSRGLVYGIDGDGKYPRGTPTNQLVTVTKAGSQFAVRLATCAGADPFPESDPLYLTADMHQMNIGAGSEWNELIYRIHSVVPSDPGTDGLGADTHGGPQVGANWASYTNADLSIGAGNGRYTWGQGTSDAHSSGRTTRGFADLAAFGRYTASGISSALGWRPVLELATAP